MRTTLDLDENILRVAKALARERGQSTGRVVSDLLKKSLEPAPQEYSRINGFPVLPPRPGLELVTPEIVRELLDREE